MAGVWWEVEVECHWLGVERGLDASPLNLQAEVHEDYLLTAITEDPTEPTSVQAVLKFFLVPCINRRVGIV